jgi:hypothetical protein
MCPTIAGTKRQQRFSEAMLRSTIQRFIKMTNSPTSDRSTISTLIG